MPLQITAEYGQWHRVIDREGQGGWVHYVMLPGVRTVIVDEDRLALRTKPSDTASVRAELEQNLIARLGVCEGECAWCELTAGGNTGWAHKSVLWGVDPDSAGN
jgi:SH3-like domain-containing protein